ncbi:MAG: hemerythrin domain-containing protein [Alphaproteobacteria bacterium]|uniref:hemerythrin domain-containing protein n=1 Tax=Brevundimonas sp. TaxID=1871086 RepID=UPI0011F9FE7A|nr:hemerythrin domain-containing protein [Brevundimonas sp.]MBU3970349.1 hemerythrin domain-containing protein [Alphaproteobacteria bacterium]MBU3974909.1 hemerythrin domain-containing protein [Alphaproteobacteria bacterium]MBU4040379.1 hemerythrin domain-containing protein [Alphaproteobacteria bacterium]MBU4135233.1 hemerythrin domain-containing protein [Alphaproteobacteria bacterium]TAJ67793.1 MAG: hemerythrin domain-containing protein [Brevundimonas sp.]
MAQNYEEMDAIAMLKADHRKVEEIFAAFEKATSKARKQALAEQACLELKVHTVIEEEVFYPACRGKIEDDLLNEAYVEHDGAKLLINDIEAGGPEEDFYDAKVKVLSEMIEHHVEEEEKRSEGMFSQARAAGLDMDALADAMRARKKSAMEEFQAGKPAQTLTLEGDDTQKALDDRPLGADAR